MWITRVSIQNPVFAAMVMTALCVIGLFSWQRLGVEQMPDISFPGAYIEVSYPGASPEAVEREVMRLMPATLLTASSTSLVTSRSTASGDAPG